MKKILSIAGGVAVVALVAVVLVYAHIPVQHANAQPAPAATVPTITASTGPGDGNYYAQIGISSAGPFTEDFQYVFCFAASPNPPVGYADQNSGDVKCETSPWASDAANDGGVSNASNGNATLTGLWSPWFYSGVPESLYSGANLYIQQINTRPLPPGLFLTNVQVGVQAASDRVGGNQQATPSDVGTYTTVTDGSACVSSITPLPDGGQGPEAYGCLYGSGNSQKSAPDVLRIYIGAQLEGVSTAGDFPSTMTSGETNTTSTITVTNIGQTTVTSAGWIETDLGPGTGACTVDTNGDGIPDQVATGTALLAPDEAIAHADEIRCSIQVNVTSTDLLFTHNGNFTTPQTVPYAFDNITKLSTWRPGYSVENNCPPQDAGQPGTQPGTPGSCKPTIVPSLLSVAYGGAPSDIAPGQTATFSVNPFTAPVLKPGVASATSTETWTLSNSQGDVPGGVYTKMITVVAGVNPPGCNLKLSDCFNSNPVEVTSENSQTSTVGNVPVPAASWDILASPSLGNWTGIEDICTQEPGVIGKCSGSSAMYPDQPTDDANGNEGLVYTIT
ncbi:MAG TPA: hypothetical protein VMR99_01565, partial [Candidatus Paceibacterota bacterium]|nr:hypothetical protein [Candidatus Paceibacterota bacterium]